MLSRYNPQIPHSVVTRTLTFTFASESQKSIDAMELISSLLPLLSLLLILLFFATRESGFMTAFTPQSLLLLGLIFLGGIGLFLWKLRMVRVAILSPDGTLELKRLVGQRTLHVADLRTLRPSIPGSTKVYALVHSTGTDHIQGDATLIALFAKSLRAQNPSIQAGGMRSLPDDTPPHDT